ncbi:filamentous hemagglutinin N-terminal domain-containing protein [uncultured Oxalicibacterium sp.]|uniref:filamentous hemagglutinin N-terminal domain-containing protein n=1 Tax=uncultured Oxalicibacterium sp. TaxID=1168540 RepID=UPI0025CBDF51|nr:filamentous hemagglutinin N-terminal domain-containing protein [uncultured Oxalicibacterium sp.]
MNGHGSLNRIFRVVWNAVLREWQVASEHTRGKGKTKSTRGSSRGLAHLAAGSILVICHAGALAELPTGGQVTAGSGQINTPSDGHMVINQNSNKMVIDWTSYSIGSGNSVQYIQPSADAIALNRVLGGDPSIIRGTISANGRVVLLNPNGILFGPTSKVEVASLLASTLNMSNEDFMAGNMRLEGDSTKAVINQGSIKAADGGFVALIAAKIENVGDIRVRGGEVLMGFGRKIRLDLGGPAKIEVDEAAVDAYIRNGGLIKVDGGSVLMTVKTAGELATQAINNEGIIEATSLGRGDGGTIRLLADGGTVTNSGTLNASSAEGKGGHIEVTGKRVGILDGAVIDASGATGGGTVLLGGDYQGKNAAVNNAQMTFVSEGATVRANATQSGDGGKVIVWSDDRTAFSGTIEAKGGAEGGNGGLVEVSGEQFLDFQGTVDTTAAKGKTGTLLLDPTNLTIGKVNTSGWITQNGGTFADFTSGTNPNPAHDFSFLRTDILEAALATTDITVQSACAAAACEGTITVKDAITWSSGKGLTLDATGSIYINADINSVGANNTKGGNFTATAATGNIELNATINANGGTSTSGAGRVGGNVNLNAADGSVILGNQAVINTSGSAAATGSTAAGGAAGSITISGTTGITLNNGDLLATGGASTGTAGANGQINLTTTTGNISQSNGSQIVGGGLKLETETGNVTLTNGSNAVETIAASSDSGNIAFRNLNTAALTVTDIGGVSGVSTGGAGTVSLTARNLNINSDVTTETGSITLNADQGQQSGDFVGVIVRNADVTTQGGNITISGRGGNADRGDQFGVQISNAVVAAGGSGTVSVTGTGGNNAGDGNQGIVIQGNGAPDSGMITSDGGAITINATGGAGAGDGNFALAFNNGGQIGATTGDRDVTITTHTSNGALAYASDLSGGYIGTGTGNLTLNGDNLQAEGGSGGAAINVRSTGNLTVRSAGTSFDNAFSLSDFADDFAFNAGNGGLNAVSSLTIGKNGNEADVAIDKALALNTGAVTVYGGDVSLDESVAAGSLAVTAKGNITQTNSFDVNSVNLNSGGDITLEGINNRAGSLTATAVDSITFNNGNNALALSGTLQGASVHLKAASVTQNTGRITTDALEVISDGNVALNSSSNNVKKVAADVTNGSFTLNNAGNTGTLTVGAVESTNGISASGAVTFNGVTDIKLEQAITAGGNVNFNNIGKMDIGADINATNVVITATGDVDLGTENASKLSLTDSEAKHIKADALTLTANNGSVTSTGDFLANVDAMSITASKGILGSANGKLGFNGIDNGVLTLTSTASGADANTGIGTNGQALTTVGASSLTLASASDINVAARNTSNGAANLDKLYITSTSYGANYRYAVTSSATLNLSSGSAPSWYQGTTPTVKGSYNISLTNTDALDFRFVGNAPIIVNATSNIGAANFALETAYGITVSQAITGTTGAISLKSTGSSGNFTGVNVQNNIQTGDGSIVLNGRGGSGTNGGNFNADQANQYGVSIGGTVSASGTGSIEITGQGGTSSQNAGDHDGVVIAGTVSATSGSISVTGTGGSGNGDNEGVLISGAVTGTSGSIAINGTGGSNNSIGGANSDGVAFTGTGRITNTTGTVALTGKSGSGTNARSIDQQGSGVITTSGLEVVSTQAGEAVLTKQNNVGTLAANVTTGLYFDNGGSPSLTVGTVNGRAGITGSGTLGLYDIGSLTVSDSIQMSGGNVAIAADAMNIIGSNTVRGGHVWLTGKADGSGTGNNNWTVTSARAIELGGNTTGGLSIQNTLLDQIHASSQLTLATSGNTTITGNTIFNHADDVTLQSGGTITSNGSQSLTINGVSSEGSFTFNGSAVGTAGQAIQTQGANKFSVSSAGVINVRAFNEAGSALINLRSLSISSTSGGANLLYLVEGENNQDGLRYSAIGTGSGYVVSANSTANAAFSFTGSNSITVDADSDLTAGAFSVNATSGNVNINNGVDIKGGSGNIRAAGNIIFGDNATLTTSGEASVRSNGTGSLTMGNNSTITSTAGDVKVRVDDLILNSGSTLSSKNGTGTVEVSTASAGRNITVGGADAANTLSLNATELLQIQAKNLVIGRNSSVDATSGNIRLDSVDFTQGNGPITSLSVNSWTGSVTQTGALKVDTLDIKLGSVTNGGGSATLENASNNIGTFTATTRNGISLVNAGDLDFTGNSGGNIAVVNDGVLGLNATSTGAVSVDNTGAATAVISAGSTVDVVNDGVLAVKADGVGAVTVNNTGATTVNGITSRGGAINVTSSGNLVTTAEINATSNTLGAETNGAAINLTSSGGTLTVGGNVISNGYSSSGTVSRQGGAIALRGQNVELGAATISTNGSNNSTDGSTGGAAGTLLVDATAGGGTVTLDGTTINLLGGYGAGTTGSNGAGGTLTINDPVLLSALSGGAKTATINAGGANVTLGAINGDGSNSLSINSSRRTANNTTVYGNVTLGQVGTVSNIGGLSVSSVNNVSTGAINASGSVNLNPVNNVTVGAINAGNLTIANVEGTTTLNGNVSTSGTNGININSKTLVSSATYTTTGGGNIKLATKDALTLTNTSAFVSSGNIDLTATDGITINGSLTTAGNGIYFRSATTLASNVTIDTTNGGTAAAGGLVSFSSTLDSDSTTRNLTVRAGTDGNVAFGGLVGNTYALGDVTIVSAKDVTTSGMKATSFTQQAGAGKTTLGGTNTFIGGAFAFTGNELAINGTLTANSATITNAGLFSTGSGSNITAAGGFVQNGAGTAQLAGNITTTGTNIGFANAVTVSGSVALSTGAAGNGNITFGGSLNNASSAHSGSTTLTAGDGVISFGGNVGETAELGNLTINTSQDVTLPVLVKAQSLTTDAGGHTIIQDGAAITTVGNQSYGDAVTLTGNATLNSGNNLLFGSTINGAHDLTANANNTLRFGGMVGGTDALTSLVATATTIEMNGGGVTTVGNGTTTTGDQTYNGRMTLGADAVLTRNNTGAGGITFNGAIDGPRALTVATDGHTTFEGAIGSSSQLASLTVANATSTLLMNGGSVTTSGAQLYNSDKVVLGRDTILQSTNAGLVRFDGDIDAAICTVASLTVNTQGATEFGGAIGTYRPLWSITTDGLPSATNTVTFEQGTVITHGDQRYGETVILGANTKLTSYSQGDIVFGGPVRAKDDGVQSLVIDTSGDIEFHGPVGDNNQRLASLDTSLSKDGTVLLNGGEVTTVGAQTYGAPVTLGDDTVLESTNGGNIVFAGTVDGNHDLTIKTDGTTRFTQAVGETTELASLTTMGAGTVQINGGSVKTAGDQTYDNAVALGANTVLTSTGNHGDVTFNSTVNGAHSLTVATAGTTTFNGAVGGSSALASITTDADGEVVINGGLVRTSGAQTFNDGVTVGANAVFTSNGPITFNDKLDGPHNVTVRTPGVTTFGGAIGSNAPLKNLYGGTGAGSINIMGPSIALTGSLIFEEPVRVYGPTKVNVGVDALFYGDARVGKSFLDVTAGGRIQYGRPVDNIKNYLPTLFAVANQNAMPLIKPAEVQQPVSVALADKTSSRQLGLGNLQFVNLTPSAAEQGGTAGTQNVSESAVNQAVGQIANDESSRSLTYIVTVQGGVRLAEGATEEVK